LPDGVPRQPLRPDRGSHGRPEQDRQDLVGVLFAKTDSRLLPALDGTCRAGQTEPVIAVLGQHSHLIFVCWTFCGRSLKGSRNLTARFARSYVPLSLPSLENK